MQEYRIVVKNELGVKLGEITDFKSLTCSKTLNRFGKCSFMVPTSMPYLRQLISLRRYNVDIIRNNVVIWSGEQVHLGSNLKSGQPDLVEITCFDYFELLDHAFTEQYQTYTQIDAGAIAWGAINTFQNKTYGDLGFTEGTIEATKNRDRKYYSKNIMELITELTDVIDGFDFEITNDKVFNVYAHKGLDISNSAVFKYGINISEITSIVEDFTSPVNSAVVLGEEIDDVQERVDVTNTSSANVIGLRQGRIDADNVVESSTLTDKGNELIRTHSVPILTIEFFQVPNTQPLFGSIALGDTVGLVVQKDIWNINTKVRVYSWELQYNEDNDEKIRYLVSIQS